MKANYKVFEYCKKCDRPLSGIKRKFCSYECGEVYRSEKAREKQTKKQLKQMKIDRIPMNYLMLNSSENAVKQAIKLNIL
tara:strand:- start:3076 stop:3315 length:240 start_codon:yes stop_codon:yes gene_type:complete